MDRRAFMVTVGGSIFSVPLVTKGQQAGNVWRVGVLSKGLPPESGMGDRRLAADLRTLGWVDGQNISIVRRYNRLLTVTAVPDLIRQGLLMSWGPSLDEQLQRAASFVDRILRGAKPVDLPVEQPTKFELAINMKTAKAMGVTIPQTLLLQADHVIE